MKDIYKKKKLRYKLILSVLGAKFFIANKNKNFLSHYVHFFEYKILMNVYYEYERQQCAR